MAFGARELFGETYEANADHSANQYRWVKLHTTVNRVAVCSAATDKLLGVQQDKASAAGRATHIMQIGYSKMIAGAAISIGDRLTSDGSSRAIATTTDKDVIGGFAVSAASNAGDEFYAFICCITTMMSI